MGYRAIPADAIGVEHPRARSDARIVSLVPSVTELLFALDLGPQIIGRTGFCVHPRGEVQGVRKLGGTKDVDLDGLLAMRPSHVIVNIDENRRETFDELKSVVPHVLVTHPNAPLDNLALYELLGTIFSREQQADALKDAFRARYDDLMNLRLASAPALKVLYLIWREPWMTISGDTYIANMLRLINWHSVPQHADSRYPELSDAAMRDVAADLCLLSSEPYPFRDKHIDEVQALSLAPTELVDGEMLSWYGSRAILGLDYLKGLASRALEQAS